MQRLRSRAFEILSTEVNQYGQEDFVSEVGRKIVMQRLEKLRSQPGDPLSFDELREVVTDQFPDFNEDILRRTAQINCPVKATPWVLWGSMTLLTVCGAVWIANLPFALIREPVTRYASILLLPTHIKTDRDYQQAMALLNQVEQQLQQPEPDPKLDSMEQRLQETSQLLNDLPKSALGSYPKLYCAVTRCDWTFTPQEYQVIESKLEQLQARVLQEQQAQTQLQQAQTGLTSAQKQYQDSTSNTTRSQAIVDWQQALDQLQKIPPGTRAGQTAQQLHPVAQQTFQTTLNTTSQTQNINALILVAQQYALKASTLAQNPPHPEAKWQQRSPFGKRQSSSSSGSPLIVQATQPLKLSYGNIRPISTISKSGFRKNSMPSKPLKRRSK
ncbi:MAG: hypothetical protein HC835_09540 [Oscillatoriales cyanobacterium RM2_1_1]|nr:hypothetical protein [Oscillatoriales cyanobacterium RM2_1_1]